MTEGARNFIIACGAAGGAGHYGVGPFLIAVLFSITLEFILTRWETPHAYQNTQSSQTNSGESHGRQKETQDG